MAENGKRRMSRKEAAMRRRRQVQRQLMLIALCLVIVIAVVIIAAVRFRAGRRDEAQRQAQFQTVREAVAAGYEQFLAGGGAAAGTDGETEEVSADVNAESKGGASAGADEKAPDRGGVSGEAEKFAGWVEKQYPDKMEAGLQEAAADGILTDEEAYDILGATMHVLSDDYHGWLKDDATAAEHNIYMKDGAQAGEVTVSVAGDLCLEEDGFVLDRYDEVNDLEQCISPEILRITNGADIFYLNHEYTVSDRGEALAGKLYTFRARPERMSLLTEMGTDLVSLANNHIYDYGEEGMLDTMDYLDQAGIPYVGGGRNLEEAEQPVYFIINGMKVGFVAASNAELTLYTPAAGEDTPGILEAYDTTLYDQVISEAAAQCDYLIAYIHWGPEDVNQYASYQTEQGREFLDAGADIVVGGHPHVLQGMEYMDGKPVIYSMGDFWFNDETKYTGLLNLTITPDGLEEMTFTPCLQTDRTTQYISDPAQQRELYDFLEGLSPNVEIDDDEVITEAGS